MKKAMQNFNMNTTIKGLPANEQTVREMFEEICKIIKKMRKSQ